MSRVAVILLLVFVLAVVNVAQFIRYGGALNLIASICAVVGFVASALVYWHGRRTSRRRSR